MATKDINILQLPLMVELHDTSQNYVVDYGGSLIKVLFKGTPEEIKSKYGKSINIAHDGQLFMAVFGYEENDKLVQFLKQQANNMTSGQTILSTGIGVKLYGKEISKELQINFQITEEIDCYAKSLGLLLKTMSLEDLYFPIPRTAFDTAVRVTDGFLKMGQHIKEEKTLESAWTSDTGKFSLENQIQDTDVRYREYGSTTSHFPCLVVMCGSGILMFKIQDENSPGELVEYSARGGRTLLGLGSLLCGSQSYDELVELASKGDGFSIDTYIRDIMKTGGSDSYGLFPEEALSFCFGKAFKKSIKDFSREDLAASVLNMVLDDMAQIAINVSIANKLPNVIYCGSPLKHERARYYLAKNFLAASLAMGKEKKPTLRMCQLGPYLGTIGTWIYGMEQEKEKP